MDSSRWRRRVGSRAGGIEHDGLPPCSHEPVVPARTGPHKGAGLKRPSFPFSHSARVAWGEAAWKRVDSVSKPKYSPCHPHSCHGSIQPPKRIRNPWRSSSRISSLPNKISVPSTPRTPASSRGVPGGLRVTSGGMSMPSVHHSKYSGRIHSHPGGPHPHG